MIRTVQPWGNQSGFVPSISSQLICGARHSWRSVSLFRRKVGIMPGPGAVQVLKFQTLSWMSVAVMVTGSCSGRRLCSDLPAMEQSLVASFSRMLCQNCLVTNTDRAVFSK